MKKIIYFFGVVFLLFIIVLNFLFTANLDSSEHINISFNSFLYVVGLVVMLLILYFSTKIIEKHLCLDINSDLKKKIRRFVLILAIVLYILFNIIWLILIRPAIVGDQVHAWNLAQTFYRGNLEEFLPNMTYAGITLREYMQAYHQQISLSYVFNVIFRFFHTDGFVILRILNVACNLLIVFALYKICMHLSKKYKTNKILLFILILTFVSIPMLATFIYGDIPSLALCLLSVYFMMKYTDSKKIAYPIFSSIFTMFAFMMRMNSLIFIIATVIYLLLHLFSKGFTKRIWKENVLHVCIIILYICISILPSSFVKNYYLSKYNLDKNKTYPNISYFLMAMEESPRGNGWYNELRGEYALNHSNEAKTEYVEEIKNRLTYFSQNLNEAFNFYAMKVASMWTENTYAAIRNNTTSENDVLENAITPLTFYQKALLILTCICSLIVLIQNRKNISLDVLFLITIFIGGFTFHILWEAKSRYIIPYIVVLIPIASIKLNDYLTLVRNKFKKG